MTRGDAHRGLTPDTPLPPALASTWRLLAFGYRQERRLLLSAFALAQVAALPDALLSLWVAWLGRGVLEGAWRLVAVSAAAIALSTTASWCLSVVSGRVRRRFRDVLTIALETHVARLQASVVGITHQESPLYLDRLAVLRTQVFVLDQVYLSVFSAVGWLVRLAVTMGLLMSIAPELGLLVICACAPVAATVWRTGSERRARDDAAAANRLARHLFETATSSSTAKEVRTARLGDGLIARRQKAWEGAFAVVAGARWRSALWLSFTWSGFGATFVAGVAWTTFQVPDPAAVLLVLAAGGRLSAYVAAMSAEVGFFKGVWLDGAQRLAWLEDYAALSRTSCPAPIPSLLRQGIRFEHVSFTYPQGTRPVLDDLSLLLPAGAVVAVVGANGAGKTTLVKLLARFYEPTAGRIHVDGVPLCDMAPSAWRQRLAGAFQDFCRFEFCARQSIGVGDLTSATDEPAVRSALQRAGASELVRNLPSGLDTQLGPSWRCGVDLSFGQWQKVALARGFMRERPLVLLLDEPTSALDAETEHALFERYAAAARDTLDGRITLVVSHRFSTVRMADLIVVLDGARLDEVGSHEALMASGGRYARLYSAQAASYR